MNPELQEQAWLADLGEMAGTMAHEFNNFLNTLVLHLAVLENGLPAHKRQELVSIRQQMAKVAAMIKEFQQYRHRPERTPPAADLNRVAQEAMREWGHQHPTIRVRAELGSERLPVPAFAADLRRLVLFLLENASQSFQATQGRITLRTVAGDREVVLSCENGLESRKELTQELEPLSAGGGLQLAACRSLVKRLHGRISAEQGPTGALVLVTLPMINGADLMV